MHDRFHRRLGIRHCGIRRLVYLTFGVLVAAQSVFALAQPPSPDAPPKFNVLDQLPGLPGAGGFDVAEPVTLTARLEADNGGPTGRLIIAAQIEPDWHLYSVTQKPGGPLPSKIAVTATPPLTITGSFQPDKPPKIRRLPEFAGVDVEEHADSVVWTASVRLPDGVDPGQYKVQVKFTGQTCKDGDSCVQVRQTLEPKLTGFRASAGGAATAQGVDAPANSSGGAATAANGSTEKPIVKAAETPAGKPGPYRNRGGHVEINGHIEPKTAKPGSQVKLVLTAKPDPHWHVYAYATEDPGPTAAYKPTRIHVRLPSGWTSGAVRADSAPVIKPSPGLPPTPYHEKPVAWTVPVTIPADATGSVSLIGAIGFQACEDSCDPPTGAEFQVELTVDDAEVSGRSPLKFAKATYAAAANPPANPPEVARSTEPDSATGRGTPASRPETATADPASSATAGTRKWSNIQEIKVETGEEHNLGSVLFLAFVGGFLLNFMPCVLPVIGLKVMSFVNQGHGSRRQVFLLNLYYVLGLLSVFVVLATLAVVFHLGWGEQFQSNGFNIALAAIVFVFALSMLGVWEIPLPGFVGTGKAAEMAEHEGGFGAFCKGILTTVLATPCTGPFMGTALTWATKQPAPVIYATFISLGVGMGLPYLLIGAFPQMVRFLPKPGAWMDTFKQVMGFVLLGTVVFIFSFLKSDYLVATSGLLVGLGIACWWIARTPGYAEFGAKFKAWSIGAIIASVIGWLSFTFLGPSNALLPWQPFSRVTLEEHLAKGNTVMVDFTADW